MPRELSPADLADLLRTTERASAKPAPPVSMSAVIARGVVAGVGAVLLLGGGLYWMQAPLDTLATAPAVAGVLVTGVVLLASAFPTEKIAPALLTVRRIQHVQATVNAAEFRKRKAYEAVMEKEERIVELQRALDRMTQERDSAILEKKQAIGQLQSATSRTFVRASNTEVQVVTDAHEMLRHWFGSNETKWFSRATANEFGWSDKRHKTAQQLLVDSGVLVINEKRPRMMVRPLDAAIRAVNDHVARVESVHVPEMPRSTWDTEEE